MLALILRGFRLVPAETRASVLEDAVQCPQSISVYLQCKYAYRMRGRPPLWPFLRATAAFAGEDLRPPMRPSSASHSGPGNTEERRPGTLRSRSRLSQCKPPPRPRISTARISRVVARLTCVFEPNAWVISVPKLSQNGEGEGL